MSKIKIILISLCIFLSLRPYFVWRIIDFTNAISLGMMLIGLSGGYLKRSENKYYIIITFFLICNAYVFWAGTKYKEFSPIFLLPLIFLVLNSNNKIKSFIQFEKIYTVVLSLGIITYFLGFFIKLPYFEIDPLNVIKGFKYKIYFFHSLENNIGIRFQSVFDECGVVGTVGALLISVRPLEFKTFQSRIIIISGLISLSLAFYIILIINILYNFNSKYIFPFVLLIFIYSQLPENNIISALILDRLELTDTGIAGDNRTVEYFDNNYEAFVHKGGNDLWFGRGPGSDLRDDSDNAGNSSYKMLVYRHGIIGMILFGLFFIYSTYLISPTKRGFFFLFVFIVLAYQRINIFLLYNIAIYFGGLAFIEKQLIIEKRKRIFEKNNKRINF